jgi:hypothetical protein
MNGYMRMLSPISISAISRDLLDTATINDWNLNNLDEKIVINEMKSTDVMLLRYVLTTLGSSSSSSKKLTSTSTDADADAVFWELDFNKVAKKTAHMLFENKMNDDRIKAISSGGVGSGSGSGNEVICTWNVEDFIAEWGVFTPNVGNGTVNKELLKGITILIDSNSNSNSNGNGNEKDKKLRGSSSLTTRGGGDLYAYAPATNITLLNTIQQRLTQLFLIKKKYLLDEFEPYVHDLVTGKIGAKSIADLLLSNTRLVDKLYYMEK